MGRRLIFIHPAYDTDAQAFITAAGITDGTQKSAINTLVVDLKANNLWTKCTFIYPMVGGTATSHKFNLKNPLDTDGAYRLTFNGGWTHASTGAAGNGTTGYADTHLAPSAMTQNSAHASIYLRQDRNSTGCDLLGGVTNNGRMEIWRFNGTLFWSATAAEINGGAMSTKGWYCSSRTASNALAVYKNSASHATSTTASQAGNAGNILFSSSSGAANFSNSEIAFATAGTGLNSTEAGTMYTIIQNFQTTLGRQV